MVMNRYENYHVAGLPLSYSAPADQHGYTLSFDFVHRCAGLKSLLATWHYYRQIKPYQRKSTLTSNALNLFVDRWPIVQDRNTCLAARSRELDWAWWFLLFQLQLKIEADPR